MAQSRRDLAWIAKRLVYVVTLLLLLPFLWAANSVGAQVKAVDIKQVQGKWHGRQTDRYGTGEVEWVVVGSEVTATVRHPNRSYTANGTIAVENERFLWNAPRSRGEIVLYESNGKRWLKYNLMGTASGVPVVGEVQEVKN